MSELYPVFEIPSIEASDSEAEQVFRPAPLFDHELGDFIRDGANRVVYVEGRDAYIIWVLKILQTQRGACLCYMNAGIDHEEAMRQPTREAVQSAFERTITDALMMNPCTERVYDFQYTWSAENLGIAFTVKPKTWAAFDAEMNVVN